MTRLPHALRILRLRVLLPLLFGDADLRAVLRRLEPRPPLPGPLPPLCGGRGGKGPRPAPGGGDPGVTASHEGKDEGKGPRPAPGGGDPEALLPLVERLTRPLRLWRTTCLWRALTGYSVLRAAGDDVRFVVGVRKGTAGDLLWHAWLERAGRPSLLAPPPHEGWRPAFAWPIEPDNLVPRAEDDVPGLHASEDALLTELRDGTGVLLDLTTRFYFTLNRTGVVAWKLLAGGAHDAAAIAAGVAARYPDADPAAVRQDVEALLAELRAEKLAVERP